MKKFIVLYHAQKGAMEEMGKMSIEQQKAGMDMWMEWGKKCGSGLIDMGTPLGNAHSMSKDNHGPSGSDVVGYSMLQAESMGEVRKMIEGHPHLMMPGSCSIEVHESLPIPGM
ncbi:MAG: hypothetical protein A3H59_00905 [Candidatus Jacksonbacteria bacterium RIFCSPLOWO2_02_FULL_43_9]|nr:MAG: hypothetical protein UV70_C0007G0016 [Parcubacteria group bacterium GW2011_GWA2_43_13]OGY69985.1 MAG: hypothetical protein A3B94_03350 [Candidatus Jacksonbacteria bacterium RIFCSPHIGHO2_02_FULL_43_10]OGY71061.1 MAG: hypothetical protein A2986_01135 [Candidatus Jacksonbacteria bacterium RIFCSPLOWO2_01_FULL_44_13]OGY73849.1 MAG: hypothetical protein A3H59_00905 [Candidatus Jacksonbacteria bacterium RIFCSPLOWO2_02_FULL_43_9]